jgi:ABC-type transport system involved in multi-copper enzyme maturation permease subunit
MKWHFLTALRQGLRTRSIQTLVIVGLLAVVAAYLASQFSGRQPATVALDVGLSSLRLIGVLLVLFWVQELFARDVDRRVLFTTLTFPVPRSHYLLGRFAAVATLAALAVLIFGLLIGILGWTVSQGYAQPTPIRPGLPLVATLAYTWLDLVTVAAFTFLIASLSTTPFLPFALGLAFALAARSLFPTLALLYGAQGVASDMRPTFGPLLEALRWLLPDLSRLDIRPAALYGNWPEPEILAWGPVMVAGYVAVLLGLASWRLATREIT